MKTKFARERLIFPLDGVTENQAQHWVRLLAGEVGLFKVGLELFIRSGPALLRRIQDKGAGVFLDLKLHDIPITVELAMGAIAELGVVFTTVHCGENPAMLEAAVRGAAGATGVLGVTVLTSVNATHLQEGGFRSPYAEAPEQLVLLRALWAQKAGCTGIVCSGHEVSLIRRLLGPDFITVTPGIRPAWDSYGPDDQARITTPTQAIVNGADYLVIGRPIRLADHPLEAVKRIVDEIEAAE